MRHLLRTLNMGSSCVCAISITVRRETLRSFAISSTVSVCGSSAATFPPLVVVVCDELDAIIVAKGCARVSRELHSWNFCAGMHKTTRLHPRARLCTQTRDFPTVHPFSPCAPLLDTCPFPGIPLSGRLSESHRARRVASSGTCGGLAHGVSRPVLMVHQAGGAPGVRAALPGTEAC